MAIGLQGIIIVEWTKSDVLMQHSLEISQEILDSARLTLDDIKIELALALYSQGRLSIGKAREIVGLSLWEFRQLSGLRNISPHLDEDGLVDDAMKHHSKF